MAQVSKNQIDKKTRDQIFGQLYALFEKLSQRTDCTVIVESLLTRTERTMLAKRIAMLILLDQSWSTRHISLTLKVSTGTVAKFKGELEKGNVGLESLVRLFRNSKKTHYITERLTTVLSEIIDFVPPHKHNTKARWRALRT